MKLATAKTAGKTAGKSAGIPEGAIPASSETGEAAEAAGVEEVPMGSTSRLKADVKNALERIEKLEKLVEGLL